MNNLEKAAACTLAVAFMTFASAMAQVDQDWLAKWNEAQTHRPQVLSASSRIAAADEPGIPMRIKGRIVHPNGATPEPGAVVFAYHTDHTGVYYAPGGANRSYRIRGWAKTDADGRFEFVTIRPAAYPNRRDPAHVHFTVETRRYGRQSFGLLFEDDPLVSERERASSAAAGRFADVLPVRKNGTAQKVTQEVQMEVRLKPKGDF